jgi:hypothetical protein
MAAQSQAHAHAGQYSRLGPTVVTLVLTHTKAITSLQAEGERQRMNRPFWLTRQEKA